MRRYAPVAAALLLIVGLAGFAVFQKNKTIPTPEPVRVLGPFVPEKTCGRLPAFLQKSKIPQPVMIDLSQKRFKGIALLYGQNFSRTLHPKQWEQYEHFSTYALDKMGNIYLAPTPFISIRPTTFSLQKKLYKLDTQTGKISIFMEIDDIRPSEHNPYGINAIAYDCDDDTLWVSSLDESSYQTQKGTLCHIDPRTKKILQRLEGFDALTLRVARSVDGKKYLLAGSARDSALYAFGIEEGVLRAAPTKLLELPDPNEHVRKIRVTPNNTMVLESIPFSYSLIAQSSRKDRTHYQAKWLPKQKKWFLEQKD